MFFVTHILNACFYSFFYDIFLYISTFFVSFFVFYLLSAIKIFNIFYSYHLILLFQLVIMFNK
jgi:hypothetical protein